jgi:cyclic beta-1,2-glucan synthetase
VYSAAWPEVTLDYRFGSSTYAIRVSNPSGVSRGVDRVTLDGVAITDEWVTLIDDGARHEVAVVLGRR